MKKIRFFDVVDLQGGKFSQVVGGMEYNLKDPLTTHGMIFTPNACSELIFKKLQEFGPGDKDKTMATGFSKSALLQILQQEDCEGIRFTICKGVDSNGDFDKNDSLVAFGLDSKGDAIGAEHYLRNRTAPLTSPVPLAAEKGNILTVGDITTLMKVATPAQIDINKFTVSFFKAI
jgi:hypothetical protein